MQLDRNSVAVGYRAGQFAARQHLLSEMSAMLDQIADERARMAKTIATTEARFVQEVAILRAELQQARAEAQHMRLDAFERDFNTLLH